MRRHVRQPDTTRECGQACVAMVLKTTLREARSLIGHRHGTRTPELARAMRKRGVICGSKLMRRSGGYHWPENCLVRMTPTFRVNKSDTHWVVRLNGRWYDPMMTHGGVCVPGRKTSYLRLVIPNAR